MKQRNRTMFRPNRKLLSCALASCLAMAAPHVLAQSTSATLRGAVTADSTVTVTNVDMPHPYHEGRERQLQHRWPAAGNVPH